MKTLFFSFDLGLLDNNAWIITIVGYSVVFFTLTALVVIFNNVHRIQDHFFNKQHKKNDRGEPPEKPDQKVTGDENAAICTALYLYFTELHDEEKYVMTVKKISKTYSPWSSKIYGIMNNMKHW
jgi:Na+-transporting methylmalonyl-CoA/oxaloacetate decarboxylase gamma subunit